MYPAGVTGEVTGAEEPLRFDEVNAETAHVPELCVPRLEAWLRAERANLGQRPRQRFVDES
jgi:hypothetical protein